MLRPTVIAIPLFVIFIAAEALWARHRSLPDYADAKDTRNNIVLGLGSVVFGVLFGLFAAYIYQFCYELSPYKFPAEAWWTWVLLFFVDDLAYYVFHRVSHETRLFWNFHVVHHSSEHYNLSVAVRQSWFSGLLHWLFYAPVMLLGFAPWMFALVHGFNLIYQFFIHTRLVGRLGILEYALNTPSHHRVHHGVNEPYLDRNYGGVLIVWDRLFGSFVEETEVPRYGIIKPLGSYDPLWTNLHAWYEMFAEMRARRGLFARLRCLLGPPAMTREPNV